MLLKEKSCSPVEGGPPLAAEDIASYKKELHAVWHIEDGKKLVRTFTFTDFGESMMFVNSLAALAEEQQHHPDMHILYNKVIVELSTHAVGGLSENDFILAAKVDGMEHITHNT